MDPAALALLKRHCRVDDFADPVEDEYLAQCYGAAEATVVALTERTSAELKQMGGGEYPEDLARAILMVAGHLYDQREGFSAAAMSTDPYLMCVVKRYEKLSNREA